jgi:hypothetical protein
MCGGVVEQVEKAVVQPIGQGLADLDKATGYNMEIVAPLVVAAVAAPYLAPALAEGAVATGAASAAEAAAALEAAALAEGATTAGMVGAANTGIPAGTTLLGGSGFAGLDAATAAELGLTGESALGTSGASGDVLAGLPVSEGAPITDYSREVTLTPGGNAVPATTLPTEMAAIDAEIAAAAKELPTRISPMQALQGLRSASGLLGGGQQPQQQMPQMQMGGRTQMPQGAVDYSGLYNLLALQRARNPNSLLG